MMQSVITEGTGARAASLGMEIAGKTGTSNDSRDAWFIGISPRVAIGVWIGFDDFRRPLGGGESGATSALPAFIDVMKALGKKRDRFVRPPRVVEARVDKVTGLLAPEGATESAYSEVFIEGTVPSEIAPAPGEVDAAQYVIDQYEDGRKLDSEAAGDKNAGAEQPPAEP
jgi:penicillin-binding protein 1A